MLIYVKYKSSLELIKIDNKITAWMNQILCLDSHCWLSKRGFVDNLDQNCQLDLVYVVDGEVNEITRDEQLVLIKTKIEKTTKNKRITY